MNVDNEMKDILNSVWYEESCKFSSFVERGSKICHILYNFLKEDQPCKALIDSLMFFFLDSNIQPRTWNRGNKEKLFFIFICVR